MIVWVIAGLLGLATGLRIGWALVNKQSLVSTAMIVALGSLGLVAALNWQPLTLLIDTLLRWPNISMGLSQVGADRLRGGQLRDDHHASHPAATRRSSRRIALAQYSVAAVIAVVDAGRSSSPRGSNRRWRPRSTCGATSAPAATSLPWLLPLLYVLLALTLVSWAGLRHSNRTPPRPRAVRLHARHRADRARAARSS